MQTEFSERERADAQAYLALMDLEMLSSELQTEDLHNHIRKSTYTKWRKAFQRANMALIRRATFHAD